MLSVTGRAALRLYANTKRGAQIKKYLSFA
jgi:hypothetical protein